MSAVRAVAPEPAACVVSSRGRRPAKAPTETLIGLAQPDAIGSSALSRSTGCTTIADWYVRVAGPLGIEALQAVKRQLDPTGLLNPGILLPTD